MASKKKERKLSEKEIARIERVERITEEMTGQGYVRCDQIISILYANIMALVYSIPFILIIGFCFLKRNGFDFDGFYHKWIISIILTCVLVVVHELIHGISWASYAKEGWKSIEFGFMKELLTPYCTCSEPLTKTQYIIGCFMPCLILGIIPSLIAIFSGSIICLVVGLLNFMSAGGDITIIIRMLRYKTTYKEIIIMDHPSECGFITFEK